jgi:ankyrin repeat protein
LNFIFLLFKASIFGHLEVVRLLINNERCNIHEKINFGRTVLHWGEYLNILINYFFLNFIFLLFKASKNGHLEVVRLLINNERCNINEKDNIGRTALHYGEYLNI